MEVGSSKEAKKKIVCTINKMHQLLKQYSSANGLHKNVGHVLGRMTHKVCFIPRQKTWHVEILRHTLLRAQELCWAISCTVLFLSHRPLTAVQDAIHAR